MILYAVCYTGPCTNWEESIVSIYKKKESAEKEREQCIQNCKKNEIKDYSYKVLEIDTDKEDMIYTYSYKEDK